MLDVVSTEYQEKISATAISGSTAWDINQPERLAVTRDTSRSSSAHCAAKHNSATVATARPMITLDQKLSTITRRCTS